MAILTNGDDHFTAWALSHDGNLTETWEKLSKLDDFFSQYIPFAFDHEFGYLTASPLMAGTGLSVRETVFIPGISQLLEAKSGIHIRLVTGKETTEIAVRPETEIRSLCADKMLSYKIDVKEIQGKDLVVQGWFIDQYRDDIIEVQDENGGTLRTEIYRVARPDVNEVFRPEDLKYRSGFNLKVPLGRISTRHITVILETYASKKRN